MVRQTVSPCSWLSGLYFSLALCSSGCSVLETSDTDPLSAAGDRRLPATAVTSLDDTETPSYVVEFRPATGKPKRGRLPHDGLTYVQDVLDKTGALKRFGRVTIQVDRPLPNGQGRHKLDVKFDRTTKRVPPQYDYAIYAGDRVIIIEDDSTALDDMLGALGLLNLEG